MKNRLLIIVLVLMIVGCKSNRQMITESQVVNNKPDSEVYMPTVVYKSIKDFSEYVPVIMNADRTRIVSYPAPTDLTINSKPTKLKDGYWLDNRGINENVVMLNYTLEDYMALKEAPSFDDMLKNIMEKYPLKELILCGSRYRFKDDVKELNALIDAGFPGCNRVRIIPMAVDLDL